MQPRLIDFSPIDPRHELPHEYPKGAPYALTETHYFAAQLLDENLDCEIYVWYHPSLHVVSAGVFCFSGFPHTHMASDYFDYQVYLPWPTIGGGSLRFVNGLELVIEEPLQRIRVLYNNESRHFRLDLLFTAVMPAVARRHAMRSETGDQAAYDVGGFEQTMKVEGKIHLGKRIIEVSTWSVRDRSYGQLRPEEAGSGPPFGWQAGAFGDDLSFGILGAEDPALDPVWVAEFDIPAEKTLLSGWVCRDGGVYQVKRLSRRIERGANGLWPISGHSTFEDSTGRAFNVRSDIKAIEPWGPWPNMQLVWALTKFEMEGRTGGGTTQEILFPDFSRKFYRSAQPGLFP